MCVSCESAADVARTVIEAVPFSVIQQRTGDGRIRIEMAAEKQSGSPINPLSSLRSLLLSTPAVEELLDELARLAVGEVDAATSCGITVRSDYSPYTLATSDPRAAIVDEQQYGAGSGPCLEALHTNLAVRVDDQAVDDRWPEYGQAAAELGVRSSLSLPLIVGERSLGALNLYAYDRASAFGEEQSAAAERFADEAAAALALALRQIEQQTLADQLERAIASRSLIDQAIGVLMGQQRCNATTAFDLLRQHSQNSNRRLRDVAADIIGRYSGHTPTPPTPFGHDASELFPD